MKNEIVEQVYNDYFKHQENLEDNDYSSIYCLVETLEDNWNDSRANLKYDLDIKDDYLYLENTKICSVDKLLYCSVEADSVKYQLKDNKYLYIVIQWVNGNDAFINQIYIEDDEDNSKILYEKELDSDLNEREKQEIQEQIKKEEHEEYMKAHYITCPVCNKQASNIGVNGAGIEEQLDTFECVFCGWTYEGNFRYLYWSDDNNVGFYKERKEDKELASIDVLEILQRNNINNFLKKFDSKYMVVTKEGIYKLEKCNSIGIYTYKKVETFEPYEGELTIYNEDKWLEGVKRNSNIKSYTFEEDESDETI